MTTSEGKVIKSCSKLIFADGWRIPKSATDIHRITTFDCTMGGEPIKRVLDFFKMDLKLATLQVCHNWEFDFAMLKSEFKRIGEVPVEFMETPHVCTMRRSTDFCQIPGNYGRYKWPRLQVLYKKLFGKEFENAHDAMADVIATKDCFF